MARLILRSDAGEREIPLADDKVVIGRDPSVTIPIQDTKSSRKHCEVRKEAGGWVVEDLGSSNGTQLNGGRIEKRLLRGGDVITIGRTEIVFTLDAGEKDPDVAEAGADEFVLIPEDGSAPPMPIVGVISIGRAPGNSLVIGDTKASGKHCEVFVKDAVGMLRDLQSTNGTRVDGQKVGETPLRQGARIAIGQTTFIFKNRNLPDDPESGLLESSALGGDFAVVGRRAARRSLAGTLLALVLIGGALGGGAWFATTVGTGRTRTTVLSPAGNLAEKNYSFEAGADIDGVPLEWTAALEGSDTCEVATRGGATGKALTIVRVEGTPPGAISGVLHPTLPVSAGRAYRIKGRVRVAEGAMAGLRVQWLGARGRGPLLDAFAGLRRADDEWQDVDTLVVPPRGAVSNLVLSAVILGGAGRADFDEVQCFEEAAPSNRLTVEAPQLIVAADPVGHVDVTWSDPAGTAGPPVLWNLGAVAVAATGARTRHALADTGGPKAEGGAVVTKLALPDPASGKRFELTASLAKGEGHVRLELVAGGSAGPAAVGLTGLVDRVRLGFPVGVVVGGEYRALTAPFDVAGVSRLWLGGVHNLVGLSLEPPAQVSLADDQGTPRLTVLRAAPDDGAPATLAVELQGRFEDERTAARTKLAQAKEAEQAGRFGEALALFDEVATKLAFVRRQATEAAAARTRLLGVGTALVDELARRHEEALFPQPSVAALEALGRRGQQAQQAWIGSAFHQGIGAVGERAAKDLAEAKIAEGEREAEAMLARGRDYFERLRQKTLGTLFLERVIAQFPNTRWSVEAEKILGRKK